MSDGEPVFDEEKPNPLIDFSEVFLNTLSGFTEKCRFMVAAINDLDEEQREKWIEFLKEGDTQGYATLLLEITDIAARRK